MECKAHKRYEGRIRPRCNCINCWIIYIENNLDIDIIDDSIEYMEKMCGCLSFEYAEDNDMIIHRYLLQKKKELKND